MSRFRPATLVRPLVAVGRGVTTLAWLAAFTAAVQCSHRESSSTTSPIVATPVSPEPSEEVPATEPRNRPRVANPDPATTKNQPDWDALAQRLRQRMDPQLATEQLADPTTACTHMLDAARAFYEATELDEDQRNLRLGELNMTRADDLARCVRETSVKAATCVRLELERRDSEFPWLLDQCSRAYPLPAEFSPPQTQRHHVGDAAPLPADSVARGVPRKSTLEMTFVGDVMFGRYRDEGFDPIPERGLDPLVYVRPLLAADMVFANLETPVVENLPEHSPIGARFRFGASREMVQLLASAGIDVVSVANNHAYDLRELGLLDTPKILRGLGVTPVGVAQVDRPPIFVETIERHGWRIGWLAVAGVRNAAEREYGPQMPFLRTRDLVERLAPLLQKARADHDVLVVSIHWGVEYEEEPSLSQQQAAHGLVDAGADLVIGHHPHVLQAIEHYGHGLIAYSLGNFLFENTEEVPRQSAVLRVAFAEQAERRCLEQAVVHPVLIRKNPIEHPVPARGPIGERIRSRIVAQADALGTTWSASSENGDVVLDGLPGCRSTSDLR